jgi:RNA polymerase sigma factor (sigma-70 family)
MIPSVGKPKITYKNHNEVNFESLDFYMVLAQKIIAKMGAKIAANLAKNMLKNEDAIAFVANAIMMGDWRWKDNSNNNNKQTNYKSLYSYRNQCGIWAIKTYITKFYKTKNNIKQNNIEEYSLNYHSLEDGEELQSIVSDPKQCDPLSILIQAEDNDNAKKLVNDILCSEILSDKQKEYIKLYFFDGLTLEKIGLLHGVTREAVRQSIKTSISKIQNLL